MNEIQRLIHEMCPDGVPMVALGDVCSDIFSGATPSTTKEEYWGNGVIPWMSSGEVHQGTVSFVEKKITKLGYDSCSTKMVPIGSVVVALAGQGKTRGTVARTRTELCTNQSLCSIVGNPKIINNDFIYYYLSSQYQQLRTVSSGDGTRGGLNLKMINSYKIPLPPLPIQQRIVEILDKFTSLVSSLDSEIALRQKQYEYYRNKLLSFEEGEEGVEWKKLIDIVSEDCSVSYGIVQPGDDTPNGIPVVRPVDMTDNIVFNKGLKRTQKENSDAYSRTILKGGEILVCVRGTTGIVSIASQGLKGCNVTRGIVPLSFKNDIETKFVFHTFKTHFIQDAIENKTNGTGLRQINIKDLKEILFPIPPLPKQLSIVRTLDTFESLLTNLKKERELRQKQYEYYREKLLTFA